jgi:hypothetical protein
MLYMHKHDIGEMGQEQDEKEINVTHLTTEKMLSQ